KRLEKKIPRVWSVSYTHLDVYKRQRSNLWIKKVPSGSAF
ncbi:hypothetical protein A5797_001846, partial [Enterococcus faecalis]